MKSHIAYRQSHIAKELFFCLLSAVLLIFSFPRSNYWIFAWIGFVPLLFVIAGKSRTKAFFLAYFTGIIFWFGVIYWLVHVTLPGLILLVLYLALYFGIFGLIITSYKLLITSYAFLLVPCIWVLLEYIRAHLFTGFPWALLGYSQYLNLPIIQIADITGVWGVSFLVMMANVSIWQLIKISNIKYQISKRERMGLIFAFYLLFFSFIYGYYRLYSQQVNASASQRIKISVIQGNIPQELKWDTQAREFIMDKYFTLSREAAKDKPDFIIWPEAALPVVLEEEPEYYEKIANFIKEIRIPILLGAVTTKNNLYYNSALLLSNDAQVFNKYDKLHLVPFGEYIPLRKILPFLETAVPIGDFVAGKEYTLFKIQNPKSKIQNYFAVLICFEDIFPELARGFVEKGAGFLVNITNDAWFGETSSAYQHLSASVFRAIENRVFLVRAANTGISGFIRPDGKIISVVKNERGQDIFVEGYQTDEVKILKRIPSFYTRFGEVFILFCIFIFLYVIISPIKKRQ